MKLALVFNGQGAHYQGMGLDFYDQFSEARQVFAEAEAVTQYPLREWIAEDIEPLKKTAYAQPTIAATSLAIYHSIYKDLPPIAVMAGLSLGEYSALMASGYLSLTDGFLLLKERGRLMSEVCQDLKETKKLAVLAIVGVEMDEVRDIYRETLSVMGEGEELYITNYNAPTQQVIAGTKGAVKAFRKVSKERGHRDLIPLRLEGPFHSPLMGVLDEEFEKVLHEAPFQEGQVPVLSNLTVEAHQLETIEKNLLDHVSHCVRWTETVEKFVRHGVTHVLQIGPGKTLDKQLNHMQVPFKHMAVDKVADLDQLAKFLTEE